VRRDPTTAEPWSAAGQLRAIIRGSEENNLEYTRPFDDAQQARVDVCSWAIERLTSQPERIVEGERLALVHVQSYFLGGIETEVRLDAALSGWRQECLRLIGAGKRSWCRD
jgi:hypothetical protein